MSSDKDARAFQHLPILVRPTRRDTRPQVQQRSAGSGANRAHTHSLTHSGGHRCACCTCPKGGEARVKVLPVLGPCPSATTPAAENEAAEQTDPEGAAAQEARCRA